MGMACEGQKRSLQCKVFSYSTFFIGIHVAECFKVGDEELNVPSVCFYLFCICSCNVWSSKPHFV